MKAITVWLEYVWEKKGVGEGDKIRVQICGLKWQKGEKKENVACRAILIIGR